MNRFKSLKNGHLPAMVVSIETDGDYRELIRHYANKYKLDKYLVQAVLKAESNFDPFAVSKAGAQGLMQLMPATVAEMSIRNPFDAG